MKLLCVDPVLVPKFWPHVENDISEAMRRGGLGSLGSVRDAVFTSRALLWLAVQDSDIRACAVTQLIETEWRRICEIAACGGKDMQQWLPLIAGLEKYARDEGCEAVRIMGRKGWQRMLKHYRPTQVILERAL